MRMSWRTTESALLRDVALVCLADGIVGVSFGAIAVAGGLPWWVPVIMSLLVFAGGAQFAAVGVALADVTAGHWWIRLLGAHITTDESVAFALRHDDPARRRSAFWTCGVTLFIVWNVAVLLGVLAGSMVTNTAAFGLDATFPAVLLALALHTLADRRTRASAYSGAATAVALTPFLPAGLPVLAALSGLAVARPRWLTRPGWLARRPRRAVAA